MSERLISWYGTFWYERDGHSRITGCQLKTLAGEFLLDARTTMLHRWMNHGTPHRSFIQWRSRSELR